MADRDPKAILSAATGFLALATDAVAGWALKSVYYPDPEVVLDPIPWLYLFGGLGVAGGALSTAAIALGVLSIKGARHGGAGLPAVAGIATGGIALVGEFAWALAAGMWAFAMTQA